MAYVLMYVIANSQKSHIGIRQPAFALNGNILLKYIKRIGFSQV